MPDAFVVAVFSPPANVPPGPEAGAAKVTVMPLTGFPLPSFTSAAKGAPNTVLIVADCGVPLLGVMEAGDCWVLVSEKLAGVPTPGTVALTLKEPTVPFAVS